MARYRAFYMISELSQLSGIDTYQLRHFIRKYGILKEKIGGRYIVYTTDIRRKMPRFWEALVALDELRQRLAMEKQEEDDFKAESWDDDDDKETA